MHRQIYDILRRRAKAEKTITYGELCAEVGLPLDGDHDSNKVAGYLAGISNYEHEHGRPLLSVVVVNKREGMPGNGFFELAKSLGRQRGKDDEFFIAEIKWAYAYWKNADLSAPDPS